MKKTIIAITTVLILLFLLPTKTYAKTDLSKIDKYRHNITQCEKKVEKCLKKMRKAKNHKAFKKAFKKYKIEVKKHRKAIRKFNKAVYLLEMKKRDKKIRVPNIKYYIEYNYNG